MSARAIGFISSLTLHLLVLGVFVQFKDASWNPNGSSAATGQVLSLLIINPTLDTAFEEASKPDKDKAAKLNSMPEPRESSGEKLELERSKTRSELFESTPKKNDKSDKKPIVTTKLRHQTNTEKTSVGTRLQAKAGRQLQSRQQKTVTDSAEIIESPVVGNQDAVGSEMADSAARQDLESAYKNTIRSAIQKNRRYPRQARRKKLQGTTVVGFRILPDGSHKGWSVVKSSGIKILDSAALNAVRKVKKFPDFPRKLNRLYWDFEVPVRFKLS